MSGDDAGVSRRTFLKGATAVSAGAISARGLYGLLETLGVVAPTRAWAAPSNPRKEEQYIVEGLQTVVDNGVPVVLPPVFTDVITARLAAGQRWDRQTLKKAQIQLEHALKRVEGPHPPTAAGLTIVVGWGLPFFQTFLPSALWQARLPVDVALSKLTGTRQHAVLDAIGFPSDPGDLVLEGNHVVFKLRTDSQATMAETERALFEDSGGEAYVGDLFDLTSKRIGFLGRGFGTPSVGKQLALAAGVAGAAQIPDHAQLMMGFTSTQPAALGPGKLPSFDTLPGVTDQFPGGYFAAGCAMHLSHLFEDLGRWYSSFSYAERAARMFSPRVAVPAGTTPVTIANGPADRSTAEQVRQDVASGLLGHNATLQQATRLATDVVDNYGRLQPAGTAVPLREDFNTLDNPFAWSADPVRDRMAPGAAPGMHFVVFVPASSKFHTARLAMDGVLPDGTNLRAAPWRVPDSANGINDLITATHRQNFLVPPRRHRSFPLVELIK